MELGKEIRLWISGAVGVVSGILGWFGWLVLIFIAAMGLDWFTGTPCRHQGRRMEFQDGKGWNRHKQGAVVTVMVSALADLLIGIAINDLSGFQLPFTYGVMLCPMVLVWYIVAEFGSIVENVGKMGAPVPQFFKQALKIFRDSVDGVSIEKEEENGKSN